ncbi:MAG: S-adenosylmethionine:tRNA ribosyltransferase-isomerase [Bacteroidetes bacterium]|nr:S-adenosylmethionine:tRNA ribosyltransferase-isomerase [Bacteroidota bacterium]
MTHVHPEDIRMEDFNYSLPDERIAQKPLDKRESSKLLIYRNGNIEHDHFTNINRYLPSDSTLIFNNTRVIPARMFFARESGSVIQVFLLNPVTPYNNMEQALENTSGISTWQCLVGKAKKWKAGEILKQHLSVGGIDIELSADLHRENGFEVSFHWNQHVSFSAILDAVGKMPLPPYIHRESEEEDAERYQTVYAKFEGAVAAPTAGLHFSDSLLDQLKKEHKLANVTLHVGAGTFKPVDAENPWQHDMHEEHYSVNVDDLMKLRSASSRIATGTTTLRTLESLYWNAVKLQNQMEDPFQINQHFAYQNTGTLSFNGALDILIEYCNSNNLKSISGSSAIMIMPGYSIRSIDGLITNFHLPKSTLLLLIAALIGKEWKNIYNSALENNYRFLSYGDSSLLMKSN